MEEKNFKKRLVEFARVRYDMGQTRFEYHVGLGNGTINKIKDGISTTTLAKIAEKCPELNLRWLVCGEGEMVEEEKPSEATDLSACLDIIRSQQRTIAELISRQKGKETVSA